MIQKISVFLMLFLLCMNFASAEFWGEGWNFLITGYAVSDEGGEAPASDSGGSTPAPESSPTPSESGYDGGDSGYYNDHSQEYNSPRQYQQYQAPSFDQGQYQEQNYQQYQGSYCGDGNCDLDNGEQYSWCPQDCDESQTQDSYGGQKGQYYGAPEQRQHGQYSPEQYDRSCPDKQSLEEMSAKCESYGGTVTERTDPYSGCTVSECFFNGEGSYGGHGEGQYGEEGPGLFGETACQSEEEAAEQSSICEEFGSEAIAVPSPPGCAPRIVCAQQGQGYGSGHLSYDEYKEGQDKFESGELGSAQVLEVILKMDSIKIQLDGVQKKLESIAGYYEEQGDTESAENYKEGSAILDQVSAKVDEQKSILKTAVEAGTLDYETVYQIRSDLKYSVDDLLNQVISALLGVTYTGIAEGEETSGTDCGSNVLCFEDYFRSCAEGANFSPESSVSISIRGTTDADECVLEVSGAMGSGTCTVPGYRYATLSKESIMPYCEFGGSYEEYAYEEEQSSEEVVEETAEESTEETTEEETTEEESAEETTEEETSEEEAI